MASHPQDARHGSRDLAGGRRLYRPLCRKEPAGEGSAGSLPARLVVSHELCRARRILRLHAGVSWDQLSSGDMAQRAKDRRQHASCRHVRRAPIRRDPLDQAGLAECAGRQGNPRAADSGRQWRGVGGQLVRLGELEVPWLQGREEAAGMGHLLCAGPQRRYLEACVFAGDGQCFD
jgi:hypothetical protein